MATKIGIQVLMEGTFSRGLKVLFLFIRKEKDRIFQAGESSIIRLLQKKKGSGVTEGRPPLGGASLVQQERLESRQPSASWVFQRTF